MNIMINPDRVRRIISECHTEADIQATLRQHKIKFTWTTSATGPAIRIPCRKGAVIISRTQSRPAAAMVPARFYPPIFHA